MMFELKIVIDSENGKFEAKFAVFELKELMIEAIKTSKDLINTLFYQDCTY